MAIMNTGERMANDPLPVAQRAPRVASLVRELDELHRVEEALVAAATAAGQPVYRSPSAPPAAVLGVRVADRISRAALDHKGSHGFTSSRMSVHDVKGLEWEPLRNWM